MANQIDLKTCNPQELFHMFRALNGIAPIHAKIHKILCDMQGNMSDNAQKVLYIYFALLDDGNTRLALDADRALKKWMIKWNSMIKLSQLEPSEYPVNCENAEGGFKAILEAGIPDLSKCDKIIEHRDEHQESVSQCASSPMVRVTDRTSGIEYLYATRYFDAKCMIERCAQKVFKNALDKYIASDKDKKDCQKFFDSHCQPEKSIKLEERQLEAILRGQNENLIITGGPGTGKTTVICFLLWKLLSNNPDMLDWDIKLAAPSGKAADRMRESLLEGLSRFKHRDKTSQNVYNKLHNLESYTLHRLLSYSPSLHQFQYNSQTPFPEKYIFVIDEASMIDIDLFARFMNALPKENYRLFILGDPNQLPSVDAGAVLGEMLATGNYAVKLDVSKRFPINSKLGMLSLAIQHEKDSNIRVPDAYIAPDFSPLNNHLDHLNFTIDETDILRYYTLPNDRKQARADLEKLVHKWVTTFYKNTNFIELTKQIYAGSSANIFVDANGKQLSDADLDKLWQVTESARILSAERKGITGVENLNALVRKSLEIPSSEPFYIGQLLMLTKNQSMLKLYNGDCGIVIGELNSGRLHLLLRKAKTDFQKDNSQDNPIGYIHYPLAMLPQDDLESAFAITIHKSQGSGYENVMMFLPTQEGHPLLNNQMVYTGVTRTEEKSLTIVTTQKAFEAGCKTSVERDTGIDISQP